MKRISRNTAEDGTIFSAVNMALIPGDGLVTEPGTRAIGDYDVVGYAWFDDGVVLFARPGKILLLEGDQVTVLLDDDRLDFGDYIIAAGARHQCGRIVYWCDGKNRDRYFNIDRPQLFFDDSGQLVLDRLWVHAHTGTPDFDVRPHSSDYDYVGRHFLFLEAYDKDGTLLWRSLPRGPYDMGDGVATWEAYGGPFDRHVAEVHLVDIYYSGDGQAHALRWSRLPDGDGARIFADMREGAATSIEEVLIPPAIYDRSNTLLLRENRLMRFGLVEHTIDMGKLQRVASRGCIKYVVKRIPKDSYRDGHDEGTLLRSGVYAVAVSFLMKDGRWTPLFHVPGRRKRPCDEAVVDIDLGNLPYTPQPTGQIRHIQVSGVHDSVGTSNDIENIFQLAFEDTNVQQVTVRLAGGGSETQTEDFIFQFDLSSGSVVTTVYVEIEVVDDQGQVWVYEGNLNFPFEGSLPFEEVGRYERKERWLVDPCIYPDMEPLEGYESSGLPGYWEGSGTYRNPPEYCGTDFWGRDCEDHILLGQPIRLVRMPNIHDEPLEDGDDIRLLGVHVDLDISALADMGIVGYKVWVSKDQVIMDKGYWQPHRADGVSPDPFWTQGRLFNNISDHVLESDLLAFSSPYTATFGQAHGGTHVHIETEVVDSLVEHNQDMKNVFHKDLPYSELSIYLKRHNVGVATPFVDLIAADRMYLLGPRASRKSVYNLSFNSNIVVAETGNYYSGRYFYGSIFRLTFPDIFSIDYYPTGGWGHYFIVPFFKINISWIVVGEQEPGKIPKPYVIFDSIAGDLRVKVEAEVFDNYVESMYNTWTFEYDDVTEEIIQRISEPWEGSLKLRDRVLPDKTGKRWLLADPPVRRRLIDIFMPFCEGCYNKLPVTIIWSDPADDAMDGRRTFRAGARLDLDERAGEIMAASFVGDTLFIGCTNGAYYTKPTTQTLKTDSSGIILSGSGFMVMPAMEMEIGNVKGRKVADRSHFLNTPDGDIWIDVHAGAIFTRTESVMNVSYPDMHSFLQEWLRWRDVSRVRIGYDPHYKRAILFVEASSPHPKSDDLKEDWSFGLSYSFAAKQFISFHDWFPSFLFGTDRHLFSVKDGKLYIHDDVPGTIHNRPATTQVEIIRQLKGKRTVKSITLKVQFFDRHGNLLHELPDHYVMAHAESQCTGIRPTDNRLYNYRYDSDFVSVRSRGILYRVSQLRNYTAGVSSDWEYRQGVPFWIEDAPLPVSLPESPVEVSEIRDTYIAVRIIIRDGAMKFFIAQPVSVESIA